MFASCSAAAPPRFVWFARARPSTPGFADSRWLGLGESVTAMSLPLAVWYTPSAPWWYFTSPVPAFQPSDSAVSSRRPPSNSARIVSYDTFTTCASTLSRPRRSEERRVGKGVDLGGRRIIKKKKKEDRRHGEYGEKMSLTQSRSM